MLTGHPGIRVFLVALAFISAGLLAPVAPAPAVVNGESADLDQFPFLVAIGERNVADDMYDGRYRQFCGGSLVAPDKVITAAHCMFEGFRRDRPEDLVVGSMGAGDKNSLDSVIRYVSDIAVHPGYDSDRITDDIAVLTLESPMVGVPYVVPSSDDSALTGGERVWSAGWGSITPNGGTYPSFYRVAPLTLFPASSCGGGDPFEVDTHVFHGLSTGSPDYVSSSRQLCAQGYDQAAHKIVDTCVGDSGGPLIIGSGQDTRLIGLVSWGSQVCAEDDPGVYTRISHYETWLKDQGVPFSPLPSATPDVPQLVAAVPGSRSLTVRMRPSPSGDRPSALWATVSAGAFTRSCVVSSPQNETVVACRISGLTAGKTYNVSTYAIVGWNRSASSRSVTASPSIRPDAPVIVASRSLVYATYARIKVTGFTTTGAPLTDKYVTCTARRHPTLTGQVNAKGWTKVVFAAKSVGGRYTCTAFAANVLGASRPSNAVTFTV